MGKVARKSVRSEVGRGWRRVMRIAINFFAMVCTVTKFAETQP